MARTCATAPRASAWDEVVVSRAEAGLGDLEARPLDVGDRPAVQELGEDLRPVREGELDRGVLAPEHHDHSTLPAEQDTLVLADDLDVGRLGAGEFPEDHHPIAMPLIGVHVEGELGDSVAVHHVDRGGLREGSCPHDLNGHVAVFRIPDPPVRPVNGTQELVQHAHGRHGPGRVARHPRHDGHHAHRHEVHSMCKRARCPSRHMLRALDGDGRTVVRLRSKDVSNLHGSSFSCALCARRIILAKSAHFVNLTRPHLALLDSDC